MTTSRSTPITRAHTLFDCTPFALALFPAFDSRKAKPGNGVHPRMLSYPPTERDGEPYFAEAARFDARADAKYFTANTNVAWGTMLVERNGRDDAERARQLLTTGRAMATAHGFA